MGVFGSRPYIMKHLNLLSLALFLLLLNPSSSWADVGGLTKCSESPAFKKRLTGGVKKLQQRIGK